MKVGQYSLRYKEFALINFQPRRRLEHWRWPQWFSRILRREMPQMMAE